MNEKIVFGAEFKFLGASDQGEFEGYGAVFNNVDSYGDMIVKGAFSDTLAQAKSTGKWPSMLLQHGFTADMSMPVGIWLDMAEDDHGLKVTGKLAMNTQLGRDAYELMKMQPRPALDGLSIGYMPVEFELGGKQNEPRRKLKKVDLMEVSLVTFPANDLARVDSVKSAPTIRIAEKALRDAGFSQNQAKAILASGFKSIGQRDVDELEELKAAIERNIASMRTASH